MTAPAYQAIGSLTAYTTGGTLTVTGPTHAADDVGIVVLEMAHSVPADFDAVWPPSGWNDLGLAESEFGAVRLYAAWKRAASSSDMTLSMTGFGSPNHILGIITTYRGVLATGDPIDKWVIANAGSTSVASLSHNSPNTTADCRIVCVVCRPDDSSSAHFSSWSGTGATPSERYDAGSTAGNGGGFGIADYALATPASHGFNVTDSVSQPHAGILIALKPIPPVTADSGNFFMFFR